MKSVSFFVVFLSFPFILLGSSAQSDPSEKAILEEQLQTPPSDPTTPLLFPHWVERVKNQGAALVLNDGSTLSIGWWWQSKVRGWKPQDVLKVSFSYEYFNSTNRIKCENITRGEVAWGGFTSCPNFYSPYTLHIQEIRDNIKIILDNGVTLVASPFSTEAVRAFFPNDVVFIFSDETDETYTLWNVSRVWVLWHVNLVGGNK
jgi:hypothetical protein